MAITQTAQLERETEETRAELEHTLGELRARISPGQLVDQATNYLRNSSGRVFLGSLRDEAVRNPIPITLIGASIAWLAISSAIGKRSNGKGQPAMARDWGKTSATTDDLANGEGHDRGPSAIERAHQTAEGWVGDASEAMSEAGDSVREGMNEMRGRAGTIYDETVGGARRAASKAAEYGRAARHAIQADGAVMTFCREQPLLIAGLGIAAGAALAAMLPASRVETRMMGEASGDLQDRARDVASDALHVAMEAGTETPESHEAERSTSESAMDTEGGEQPTQR